MTESDDFSTGGVQARTEAQRLRAQARHAIQLANAAITDQEAYRALQAYTLQLLEKADALERQGET